MITMHIRSSPLLAACFCLAVNIGYAQLSDSDRTQLVDRLQAAAAQLEAGSFPDLTDAKQAVLDRVEGVDNYLKSRATATNRQAWLRYLDTGPVVESIRQDEDPVVVARNAISLRHRLVDTSPGLELLPLSSLRDATEELIDAVRFRDRDRATALLSRRLDALATRIGEGGNLSSIDIRNEIASIVSLLSAAGQAENTTELIRSTYGQPNIAIRINGSIVGDVVAQSVERTTPVRDCILGTRVVGDALLTGTVTARLIPSAGSARIAVGLVGRVDTKSVGYNGPVKLRTVGVGDVNVTRAVAIGDSGVSFEPTQIVQASLDTEVRSIQHQLRLVRKIARRRAAQQKPLADRIALRKFRSRIVEQFESNVGEEATAEVPDVIGSLTPVLQRLSIDEPPRFWGSTSEEIYVDSLVRRDDQISTVIPRPEIREHYTAAIQVHESAIQNAVEPVFAGRTVTDKQLRRMIDDLAASLNIEVDGLSLQADSSDPEEEIEPFEIDFAQTRPIVLELRDGLIRFGVRGRRFAVGPRELKEDLEVTATYKPERTDDGRVILRMVDKVGIEFSGGRRRLRVREAGLRRTIEKRFSNVFPDTLLERPLVVPETSRVATLRGRAFQPFLIQAEDGWVTIAIR